MLRSKFCKIATDGAPERLVGLGVPVGTIQDATKKTTHDNYVRVGEGKE